MEQVYQALITLDGWTFLAQICNLMIQMLIFKKFLLNPVKKVIADRKAKAQMRDRRRQKAAEEAEAGRQEHDGKPQERPHRSALRSLATRRRRHRLRRRGLVAGPAAAALKQKALC